MVTVFTFVWVCLRLNGPPSTLTLVSVSVEVRGVHKGSTSGSGGGTRRLWIPLGNLFYRDGEP